MCVFVSYVRGSWLAASGVDVGIEHTVKIFIRVTAVDESLFQVLDGSVEVAPISGYFISSDNECLYRVRATNFDIYTKVVRN